MRKRRYYIKKSTMEIKTEHEAKQDKDEPFNQSNFAYIGMCISREVARNYWIENGISGKWRG